MFFPIKACIGPPQLPHARLIGPPDKLTMIGKTRKYKCEKDYFETGLVEVICNPDLTWQETGFRCKGMNLIPITLRAICLPFFFFAVKAFLTGAICSM